MTRACGCSGDECCQSDAEAAQKRPAEKSRCCHDRGDGSKLAKLEDSRRKARLPCGCGSEGGCLRAEVKKLACGCEDEADCLLAEKRPCGCTSEGDCFDNEGKAAPMKLACGCASEAHCFHEESKRPSFECGCKSEGDCLETKQDDPCWCASGKPCGSKMETKERCCGKRSKRRLVCGCKSEGDCFHEAPRQLPTRLPCGCKSEGDCDQAVAKLDPCGLSCGCKAEGDCFHEVIKQIPAALACGCSAEADCFHQANQKSGDYKDRKIQEMLELSGPRTDEIYRTFNIPTRFMYPKLVKGYRDKGGRLPHPCYRATSTDYGWFSPTVHTVPTSYYPRDYAFSVERSRGGMYRNCSLNTDLDKHFP